MPFNVRIFGFRGIQQIPAVLPRQDSSDSIWQVVYPPEFRDLLVADAAPVQSTPYQAATAAGAVTLLRIEVPNQAAIRWELRGPGGTAVAGNTSPRMEGTQHIRFADGWTISIVDAANFP